MTKNGFVFIIFLITSIMISFVSHFVLNIMELSLKFRQPIKFSKNL